jgi:Flp pilus assembly pilin Flp
MRRRFGSRSGQAAVEYALLYAGVILPLTFMVVFVAEMLWIWHSVADFTRDGARYAATHCWMADSSNVVQYMQTHVPRMIDMDKFQNGAAGIQVQYFQQDPATGSLGPFSCQAGECSAGCVPDAVSVSVTSYQFLRFSGFFRLPPVTMPPFATSVPMESAGCDESGNCLP